MGLFQRANYLINLKISGTCDSYVEEISIILPLTQNAMVANTKFRFFYQSKINCCCQSFLLEVWTWLYDTSISVTSLLQITAQLVR
jgi:hypothetical protein